MVEVTILFFGIAFGLDDTELSFGLDDTEYCSARDDRSRRAQRKKETRITARMMKIFWIEKSCLSPPLDVPPRRLNLTIATGNSTYATIQCTATTDSWQPRENEKCDSIGRVIKHISASHDVQKRKSRPKLPKKESVECESPVHLYDRTLQ